jgi:4a-hydroxytetrahydrobiopterin dehydratase
VSLTRGRRQLTLFLQQQSVVSLQVGWAHDQSSEGGNLAYGPAFYTHTNPVSATPTLSPPSARIAVVMSDLAAKACIPCRGGVPPLKGEELASLQRQVDGWNAIEEHHITKTFTFPDFRGALTFVNRVGELAEEQGHHPDISLAWGKVGITTWTHKINGLTESDFILAAKIDQLYKS